MIKVLDENDLDCAYSVIDGQFLKDELASLGPGTRVLSADMEINKPQNLRTISRN